MTGPSLLESVAFDAWLGLLHLPFALLALVVRDRLRR
jgi:hypothetical protein